VVVAGAGIVGLALSPTIVFAAPRLVRSRFDPPPDTLPTRVLVPLIGVRDAGAHKAQGLLVEIATAFVLAGLAFHETTWQRLAVTAAFSFWFLAIAYIDLKYRLVLNTMSYPGIVLALAASALWLGTGAAWAFAGAAAALVLFAFLQFVGRGALGTGDTKLAVLIGALVGFPAVFETLFLGMLLGGFGAAFQLIVLRRSRKSTIPYAPYLAAAAILSIFFIRP